MKDKKAFLYIDDDESTVKAFKDTVRREWNLNYDVLSNLTFGPILEDKYDDFEKELLRIVNDNLERIECIFLDIDFSSATSASVPDMTGLLLGRAIRKRWPALPIILATRFVETEMYRKGMIFDFDNLCDPTELIQMDVKEFTGMIGLTQGKRLNFLQSIGDVPVSYRMGTHQYFKNIHMKAAEKKYAFVAMPFGKIIRSDVWKLGIREGCKKAGIRAVRVDEDRRSVSVIDKIATLIFNSEIVIADLTGWNANVLYELGIAHTINKPCILLTQKRNDLLLPFDVRHIKTLIYSSKNLSLLREDLKLAINDWISSTK